MDRDHLINTITIINQMRGSASKQKSVTRDKQAQIAKESDDIMKKIQQLKEGLSPGYNHKFGSDHREKWNQYLPVDNLHSFASVSNKEEGRLDNYRQSLEQRLEKLFKQEKDLLKERHFASSFGKSQFVQKESQSKGYGPNRLRTSDSIDNMERKIRQLEQKYKEQEQRKTKQKQFNYSAKKEEDCFDKKRKRIRSDVQKAGTEQSSKDVSRQHKLEVQMQKLKYSMIELRQSNKELTQKLFQKEEKKKHKQRTKEILLNILHKLEFINAEISSVKRKERLEPQKTTKMQEGVNELLSEFEDLKVQYRNLNQLRKSIQKRQCEVEKKLGRLTNNK